MQTDSVNKQAPVVQPAAIELPAAVVTAKKSTNIIVDIAIDNISNYKPNASEESRTTRIIHRDDFARTGLPPLVGAAKLPSIIYKVYELSKKVKGKFKGGKQNKRDKETKDLSKDFVRWHHKYYKDRGMPDPSRKELEKLLKEWKDMGQPKVK